MTEEQCHACAEQVKRECARADALESRLKVYETAIKQIADWEVCYAAQFEMREIARKALNQ